MGTDLVGSDGSATYTYYLNVCGVLSSTPAAQCTAIQSTSSACQVQVSGGTGAYDIGNWMASAPPAWNYVDPANPALGVGYSMMGAQSCWAHPPVQYYSANILFTCSTTTGPLSITIPQGSCVQNYTYPTPLACGGASGGDGDKKAGLSGGWIFIIILLVTFPVYIVGGCVFKSQRKGTTGMVREAAEQREREAATAVLVCVLTRFLRSSRCCAGVCLASLLFCFVSVRADQESCPNVDFWRGLPGLCKDGCVFTFSKLRGLCAGGGGAKAGSYETM